MSESNANLKPFESSDWDAWAGAERYSDGREPLIGYVGRAAFIADGAGIGLFWGEQEWVEISDPGNRPEGPMEARALAQEIFTALTGEEA